MSRELTKQDVELLLDALVTLAVALCDHDHQWTSRERDIYDSANALLGGRKIIEIAED